MTTAEKFVEKFSETGLPVFEKAAELCKERMQNHIAEGHIIVALFQTVPDWATFRISQQGIEPKQILRIAEAEIESTKPFTKGGLKIHPSATIFFRQAMKFAKADGRSQIDCLDLISALSGRIRDLTRERDDFDSLSLKGFRLLKRWFSRNMKSRNSQIK